MDAIAFLVVVIAVGICLYLFFKPIEKVKEPANAAPDKIPDAYPVESKAKVETEEEKAERLKNLKSLDSKKPFANITTFEREIPSIDEEEKAVPVKIRKKRTKKSVPPETQI